MPNGTKNVFLAPTGAQGVTMCVRPSVRSFGSNLSRALNLHLSNPDLKAITQSVILRAFHLESHPPEPKILRLVNMWKIERFNLPSLANLYIIDRNIADFMLTF